MKIETIYETLCTTPSDINEHLPTLKKYALECDHITEFGVRYVVSTYALLAGKPKKMISYDINPVNWIPIAIECVNHTDFTFIQGNTLEIEIEPTELLFIDTLHNYNQLSQELKLHGNKVSKYLIFHDTTSYELNGESYDGVPQEGIWKAIEEFMESNPHWKLKERFFYNNGLTILKRTS